MQKNQYAKGKHQMTKKGQIKLHIGNLKYRIAKLEQEL